MSPPPPARLSTMTAVPSLDASRSASRRAKVSAAPPGVDGAIMRIGRDGQSVAATGPARQVVTRPSTMPISPVGFTLFLRDAVHRSEFLHPLAAVDFAGEDVALGINGDVVHVIKQTRVASRTAERADNLAILAPYHAHLVVRAIRGDEIGLGPVRPRIEIPRRAAAAGLLQLNEFLHEAAVATKHLDAVVDTVANV